MASPSISGKAVTFSHKIEWRKKQDQNSLQKRQILILPVFLVIAERKTEEDQKIPGIRERR